VGTAERTPRSMESPRGSEFLRAEPGFAWKEIRAGVYRGLAPSAASLLRSAIKSAEPATRCAGKLPAVFQRAPMPAAGAVARESPGPHTLRKDNVDKSMMNPLHTGGSARVRFNGAG
jgi:hypothetical protein